MLRGIVQPGQRLDPILRVPSLPSIVHTLSSASVRSASSMNTHQRKKTPDGHSYAKGTSALSRTSELHQHRCSTPPGHAQPTGLVDTLRRAGSRAQERKARNQRIQRPDSRVRGFSSIHGLVRTTRAASIRIASRGTSFFARRAFRALSNLPPSNNPFALPPP